MSGWKKLQNLFVVFGLSCQLIACAKPDSLSAVFTEAPSQAVVPATVTQRPPSLTATETSVPMLEPALPPAFSTETLPVTPPNFETVEKVAEISFDLTAAHAVYAYYRQEVGPLYNLPETNFVQEMSQYYKTTLEPNGIHLLQSAGDSGVYSILTRGSQFFAYFTPEGVLADYVPGHWSKTGVGQWVEAGGTNGPLGLFIGEDGLAYIAQLGSNDDVVYRFFNPIEATLDNLDEQWIPVRDGKSTLAWDGEQGQWVNIEEAVHGWNQEKFQDLGQVELKDVEGQFTLIKPERGKLVIEGFDDPINMGWTQTKDGKWVIYDTLIGRAIETISKEELQRLNIMPGYQAKKIPGYYDARGFLVGFETRNVLLDLGDKGSREALFGVFRFYDPFAGGGKGVVMESYIVGGDANIIAYAMDFDTNKYMNASDALNKFQLGDLVGVLLLAHSIQVEYMDEKDHSSRVEALGWSSENIEAMYYFFLNRLTMVEEALNKRDGGGIVEVGQSLQISDFSSQ